MKSQKVCITAALLYANGPVHLGHMVEYTQADIAARFYRMLGHKTTYICGSDAHGTAIMLSAEKRGITPEALIEEIHQEHSKDMADFHVQFDNFGSTHSPENQELANTLFQRLEAAGDITRKTISQAYDAEHQMFLPDRYVKGTCPSCKTEDQYGDNCENCGASYTPTDLINPLSVLSGKPPARKETEHLFFELDKHRDFLLKFLDSSAVPDSSTNKLKEWFGEALRAWDISRDAPYFGFPIPGNEGKYFYVWFDAPIGYMASHQSLAKRDPSVDFDETWKADSTTKLIHIIGKDIVYFHALFWPTVLKQAGYRIPNQIQVHGYLTINGTKMSKSRGTFITARQYLDQLNPEYLRYYFAAKLSASTEDIDLNLEDFRTRVNADLVGKFVNIASRCAGFISKHFDGQLASELHDALGFDEAVAAGEVISKYYITFQYSKAMREIMQVADKANQYIDHHKPWVLAKEKPVSAEVQAITTQGLNLFKLLATYLKPVLPKTVEQIEAFLNCGELSWANRSEPLLNHKINPFKPLLTRITPEAIEALTDGSS
jgi:methionyl-tRNA synthetase